jgi:hypothetical protein
MLVAGTHRAVITADGRRPSRAPRSDAVHNTHCDSRGSTRGRVHSIAVAARPRRVQPAQRTEGTQACRKHVKLIVLAVERCERAASRCPPPGATARLSLRIDGLATCTVAATCVAATETLASRRRRRRCRRRPLRAVAVGTAATAATAAQLGLDDAVPSEPADRAATWEAATTTTTTSVTAVVRVMARDAQCAATRDRRTVAVVVVVEVAATVAARSARGTVAMRRSGAGACLTDDRGHSQATRASRAAAGRLWSSRRCRRARAHGARPAMRCDAVCCAGVAETTVIGCSVCHCAMRHTRAVLLLLAPVDVTVVQPHEPSPRRALSSPAGSARPRRGSRRAAVRHRSVRWHLSTPWHFGRGRGRGRAAVRVASAAVVQHPHGAAAGRRVAGVVADGTSATAAGAPGRDAPRCRWRGPCCFPQAAVAALHRGTATGTPRGRRDAVPAAAASVAAGRRAAGAVRANRCPLPLPLPLPSCITAASVHSLPARCYLPCALGLTEALAMVLWAAMQ